MIPPSVAELYPIRRLPRAIQTFDYLLPEGIPVQRGDILRIPFRNEVCWGMVKNTRSPLSPSSRLKSVIGEPPLLRFSEHQCVFYESLADSLIQSVSSVLYAALPLPPLPPTSFFIPTSASRTLKIRTSDTTGLKARLEFIGKRRHAFIACQDMAMMAALILAYLYERPQERARVILPHIADVERLIPFFSSLGIVCLTGNETLPERYRAWRLFEEGSVRVFMGTRLLALLPSNRADVTFVCRSSHEDFLEERRNPRYDARDCVRLFSSLSGNRTVFLDTAPRVDEVIHFSPAHVFFSLPQPSLSIVDLCQEKQASPHPRLSYSATCLIDQCLEENKRVIGIYNRLGTGKNLSCQDCAFSFSCEACQGIFTVYETTLVCHRCGHIDPRPFSCPSCRGTRLMEQGYGIRSLRKVLARLYPTIPIGLMEKGTQENIDAPLVIATSFYAERIFDPFSHPSSPIGAIINFDADLSLHQPSFRSSETTIRHMESCRGMAYRLKASCLIQTHIPHLFGEYEKHPERFFQEEATLRQNYHLPPVAELLMITHRSDDVLVDEAALYRIKKEIEEQTGITVKGPILAEKQGRHILSLCIPPERSSLVRSLLRILPDRFIIDTHPSF